MKFRAPPHCAVMVHGGVTLIVAADGTIEAPESEAAPLLAHGFMPWVPATMPAHPRQPLARHDIEAMPRSAVIAALKHLGRAASPSARTPELRRALRQALAARV